MSTPSKRKNAMDGDKAVKRVRKECSYGEKCYRKNPAHLREFSHSHLESILDEYDGSGTFDIPSRFSLLRDMITEQLEVMIERKVYEPGKKMNNEVSSSTTDPGPSKDYKQENQLKFTNNPTSTEMGNKQSCFETPTKKIETSKPKPSSLSRSDSRSRTHPGNTRSQPSKDDVEDDCATPSSSSGSGDSRLSQNVEKRDYTQDPNYQPVVAPKRRPEEFLKVVLPSGNMAAKHASSAPYYIFYTAIKDARETHKQPYSITFLEILDSSLGELKCSLQINFMVDPGWLLAQYYFAGYCQKRMTILYGDDSPDMRTLSQKKPHVDAHYVSMPTPFGKHHTKMMILCYEDGSLRVVVSTANLYVDDWDNRTQGLWFSPSCAELPPDAMPCDGESPTLFKKSLLRYLAHYHLPKLAFYMERVRRCDFSHINVFLVASAPGSHFDVDWGMTRVGALLRQHCAIPTDQNVAWPLLAQASSIGSFGKEPRLWLTGDFLHHFTKIKNPPQMLSPPPELKVIYPSIENVLASHDEVLGGGCLPYSGEVHKKQLWLQKYLYHWRATLTGRDKAMPHIKTYTRTSPDNKFAAFYLLTSGNISKAAWGSINKGNAALRVMSYEAGVLFLPRFVIKQDFFPLEPKARNRLIIPYDIPPTKYKDDTSPWISEYIG